MITGMMARRIGGAVAVENAWDPSQSSLFVSFSDLNRVMESTGSSTSSRWSNTISLLALTGKSYFSLEQGYNTELCFIGVGSYGVRVTTITSYYGVNTVHCTATAPNCSVWSAGAVIGDDANSAASPQVFEFAVDAATRNVWVRKSGGSWIGGGDPAAGTSPTKTIGGTEPLHIVGSVSYRNPIAGRYVKIHRVADITGTPPSGFTPGGWA